MAEVGRAHSLLLQFCREVERIYGTRQITPNMHMHSHLADCILDYDPVYSFWLSSFERYNSILGAHSTNNKSVELQLIREFLRDQLLRDFELPQEYGSHFKELIDRLIYLCTRALGLILADRIVGNYWIFFISVTVKWIFRMNYGFLWLDILSDRPM